MITKSELQDLAEKYETVDFIKDDPIQFPWRFMPSRHCEGVNVTGVSVSDIQSRPKQSRSHLQDIEIAAFVSSLFAYGNRKIFIKKLDELFEIMQNKPLEFVLNFKPETLKGFNYRFAKDYDVIEVFNILHKLYAHDGGLKKLFEYGYNSPPPQPSPSRGEGASHLPRSNLKEIATVKNEHILPPPLRGRAGVGGKIATMLQTVTDYFYSNVQNEVGQGFYHFIPPPKNGGAVKRMNMFLRWMVRKPPVDLGVWDFIPTSELLIPLDVHVARLSREMGLLKRNSNDFKAVLELTQKLKEFDPNDPVKYDFAIFGLGVNKDNI